MKLEFVSVTDSGKIATERIVLRSKAALDIGAYACFRALVRDGRVTNAVRSTYWFPDKAIGAGDLVVLYTKLGPQSEKPLADGTFAHFFYWGLSEAAWGATDVAPVLVHVGEWDVRMSPASEQTTLFGEGQSAKSG
ncbi:MAG: hypothetical protein ABL977_06530 [Candidatus Eisenbacteria bacterium]